MKNRSSFQIGLNIIFGIISGSLSCVINFLLTPLVTKELGIDAYGFLSLSNTIIGYINILSVGINSFAARYVAVHYHNNNIEKANRFYNSILLANIILVVIVVIPMSFMIVHLENFIIIPNRLNYDVKILFALVLINYSLGLLTGVFSIAAFIVNKISVTSTIKSFALLVYAITLILNICFFNIKVYTIAIANLIVGTISLVLNYGYSRKAIPKFNIHPKYASATDICILIRSGVYNSINSLGGTLGSGLDLLITNKMLSNIIMGQIAVANQIGGIINIIIIMISNSFQPKQLEEYSKGNLEGLVKYLIGSMKLCSILSNVFVGCYLLLGKNFFSLWIPEQDGNIIFNITYLVLIGNLLIAVVTPLYYIATLAVRMKTVCMVTIISGAINVLSMVVLLSNGAIRESGGGYVIVLTTTISNIGAVVLFPYIGRKYLNLSRNPFIPTILKHYLNALLIFLVYRFFVHEIHFDNWIKFLFSSVVCAIAFLIMSCLIILNKDDWKVIITKYSHKGRNIL